MRVNSFLHTTAADERLTSHAELAVELETVKSFDMEDLVVELLHPQDFSDLDFSQYTNELRNFNK